MDPVPPLSPVSPSTTAPPDASHKTMIPTSMVIVVGLVLAVLGFMFLFDNVFPGFFRESGTPVKEKEAAMEGAKVQAVTEGRPELSREEKLKILEGAQ